MLRTPRYGRKIRKNYVEVMKKQKAVYECPVCGKKKVKRIGNSLWVCKGCGTKFAGGAYEFITKPGETLKAMLSTVKA